LIATSTRPIVLIVIVHMCALMSTQSRDENFTISFQPDDHMAEYIADMYEGRTKESRSHVVRELIRAGMDAREGRIIVQDTDAWHSMRSMVYRMVALISIYIAWDTATPYLPADYVVGTGIVLLAFAGLLAVMAMADAVAAWVDNRRRSA